MAIDPAFGLNNFGKPKMYSETETLANNILAVLFGRPGAWPSMPNLGMYIQGIVGQIWDDINTDDIKTELTSQCSSFREVVQDGEFSVEKRVSTNKDGEAIPLLLIMIPTQIKSVGSRFAIAIGIDKGGVIYNFRWID